MIAAATDLDIRGVEWLWPGRFAIGKVGLIAGLPDMGKGQIAASSPPRLPPGCASMR